MLTYWIDTREEGRSGRGIGFQETSRAMLYNVYGAKEARLFVDNMAAQILERDGGAWLPPCMASVTNIPVRRQASVVIRDSINL
jgi:hypothetical protein